MSSCSVRRAPRFTLVIVGALVASACTSAPAVVVSAGAPVDGNSFVVRNVRVFDGDGTRERMNVVVAAGRIMTIGRTTPPSGLPVIDGTGRTLLPGLIDAHAHVPSAASLRNALRFGVTTELDMLSDINVARTLTPRRDRLDRTDLADLYSAGSPFTSPRGLGTQFGLTFSTISRPDEAAALVKGRLAEGSDYIKILYEPGAPLFTTVSRETLAAVIAAAHAAGVLAVVHISSIQGARDAVRAGVDGLVHVFSDSLIDEAFAREIAERKVFVSPTLSIFGAFQSNGFGSALAADVRIAPFLSPAQRTELTKAGPGADHPMAPYLVRFDIARALENVRMLKAAGVRLLAGTDAPNLTAHGASVHGEMELLTQAGLTPVEALAAATRAPAEAYHLAGRGRIALGARADLVLVDGNPLVDITATRAIVRVFKNGFEVTRVLSPSATPPAR